MGIRLYVQAKGGEMIIAELPKDAGHGEITLWKDETPIASIYGTATIMASLDSWLVRIHDRSKLIGSMLADAITLNED